MQVHFQVWFERLDLAAGTPYENDMMTAPEPQRVLAPAVARTVESALSSVVGEGTARAVSGAILDLTYPT